MSPEEKENKALGRRVVEALNSGNLTTADEVYAPSYGDQNPFSGATPDRDGSNRS